MKPISRPFYFIRWNPKFLGCRRVHFLPEPDVHCARSLMRSEREIIQIYRHNPTTGPLKVFILALFTTKIKICKCHPNVIPT